MHDPALLTQWFRRGDAEAFRALTVRYGCMVYASAMRVLGNPSDAEEVTQECFEKLARARRAPGEYLGPWLHRMAVNKAVDRRRSDARRHHREQQYEAERPPAGSPAWDDVYPLVDEAVTELPEPLRRAIVAHFLEGLTQEEIAQREGVARTTVTYRVKQGLDGMRASLRRKGIAVPAGLFSAMLGARDVPRRQLGPGGRCAHQLAGPVLHRRAGAGHVYRVRGTPGPPAVGESRRGGGRQGHRVGPRRPVPRIGARSERRDGRTHTRL